MNPLQFGPKEDLSRYPRTPELDDARARDAGVDVVYQPTAQAMYPPGFQTTVTVATTPTTRSALTNDSTSIGRQCSQARRRGGHRRCRGWVDQRDVDPGVSIGNTALFDIPASRWRRRPQPTPE
jgi:hypothetical protein